MADLRCPRCGNIRPIGPFNICAPCAAAQGFDPPCEACKLEGRGVDPDGVRHVSTCAVSVSLSAPTSIDEQRRRMGVPVATAYERGVFDAGIAEGLRRATEDAYGAEPADLGDGYHELELAHGRWYHLDELGVRVMVSLRRPYTLLRWKALVGPWEPAEQPEDGTR